jgi:GNAT superfamily N-acetyltransferase
VAAQSGSPLRGPRARRAGPFDGERRPSIRCSAQGDRRQPIIAFRQRRTENSEPAMNTLRISTDPGQLDLALVHRFLSEQSYWAQGIPLEVVRTSLRHSLCFGGYLGERQVAFARVITDYATFANLSDVFVLREHRGHGYATALITAVIAHPRLRGVRRFMVATSDAHGLYRSFGFTALVSPDTLMERYDPNPYLQAAPISKASNN